MLLWHAAPSAARGSEQPREAGPVDGRMGPWWFMKLRPIAANSFYPFSFQIMQIVNVPNLLEHQGQMSIASTLRMQY
jgi:hypothetical protein